MSSRDLAPSLAASAAAGPAPCVLLVEPLLDELDVLDAPLLLLEVLLPDVLLELPELLPLDVLLEVLLPVLPVVVPTVAVVVDVVASADDPEPLLETSTPPQPLSAAPTQKIPSRVLGRMKLDIM